MKEKKRQKRTSRRQGDAVKGTSRRVVVVPGEDGSVFEEIIYIVRDGDGVTQDDILREAGEILEQKDHDVYDDTETEPLTRALFWISGAALALSCGVLIYWFAVM